MIATKMKNKYLQICLLFLLFCNCTSISEDDLIDSTQILTEVTYSAHIKNIIDNNCIICHTNPPENGAPMHLLTYTNVKEAVENRGLINRISSFNQDFLMPFGVQRLPQNLIDMIIQWEVDGFLVE